MPLALSSPVFPTLPLATHCLLLRPTPLYAYSFPQKNNPVVLGSLTFYSLHYKLAFAFIACPMVSITVIKLTWEKKGLQVTGPS